MKSAERSDLRVRSQETHSYFFDLGVKKTHELALATYSRATGVQFLTGFSVFWMVGSVILPQPQVELRVIIFDVVVLAFGGALAAAIYLRARRTKRDVSSLALSSLNAALQARRSRIFRWVNAAQYLGLGLAGLRLSAMHRFDLLVPTGIFIIGAHFLPLAILFRYPFHLATGIVLIGWSLAYPHLFALGGMNPMGLSVTGLILLLSACWSSYTASTLAQSRQTASIRDDYRCGWLKSIRRGHDLTVYKPTGAFRQSTRR